MSRLISSGLLADTLKLVSGTIGGRLVLLAVLPLITRLYSSEDFTLLAVYMALINTIGVAACLRLEIAIPFAEDDQTAADLLLAAVSVAATISLLVIFLALAAPLWLARLVGSPEIAPWLWLVGFGIFCIGSYGAFQFWATRSRRFGAIARTRVSQALSGAATMLGLGWLGLAPLGLLLGNMFTTGAGGIRLAFDALRQDRALLRQITPGSMRAAVQKHRRYPLFSTPEALANVAGIQVPILMISAFSGAEAGQLFLAMQVMAAPMTLLATSVGQVYASRAAEEMRHGRLRGFTLGMMRRLFLIGLGPMVLAGLLSPWLFAPVFGTGWERAGQIAAWITPWMLFQLVVSPVSMLLHANEKQKTAMLLQIFGLILRCGGVVFAIYLGYYHLVEIYAVSSAVFYLLYGYVLINSIRR